MFTNFTAVCEGAEIMEACCQAVFLFILVISLAACGFRGIFILKVKDNISKIASRIEKRWHNEGQKTQFNL